MKLSGIEKTALLLFGLAVLILAALVVVSSTSLIAATLILIAFACFIAGLFIFTFRKKEQVDAGMAGLLPVPYMITTSRLISDLGVSGAARFIPVQGDMFRSPVMQFNPVAGYRPVKITRDESYVLGPEGSGVLTVPSGFPLFSHLAREKSLTVPVTEPDLFAAVKEAGEDLLEIADLVTATRSGEEFIVTLRNFLLVSGCRAAREESALTCMLAPCPVCSLFAMMLAMGTGNTVALERVSVEKDMLEIRVRQELEGTAAVKPEGETPVL